MPRRYTLADIATWDHIIDLCAGAAQTEASQIAARIQKGAVRPTDDKRLAAYQELLGQLTKGRSQIVAKALASATGNERLEIRKAATRPAGDPLVAAVTAKIALANADEAFRKELAKPVPAGQRYWSPSITPLDRR